MLFTEGLHSSQGRSMRSFLWKGLGFEPQHLATWPRCPVPPFTSTGLGPYLRSSLLINMQIAWVYGSKYWDSHTKTSYDQCPLHSPLAHKSSPWDGAILSSSYWQQLQVILSLNTDFHTLRWQWHPPCELTDPAATVWAWAGEAWAFSEDVLQGFRIHLH